MANTRFKSNYGINATANSYIDGTLEVTSDLVVGGNLSFTGTTVGNFIPDADQRTLGNTVNRWNLIGFYANLASTLNVTGATSLSNTIQIVGQATLQNNIVVSGYANVGQQLNVVGAANLANSLYIGGNTDVIGTFTANANSSFTNNLVTFTSNATSNVITIGAANVTLDSGVLFVDSVNNRVGINNNAPAVALRVTGDVDITATANIQGATTLRSSLDVAGNSTLSGVLQTISGNAVFDSGVLFVDSVNNRVGINNTAPAVALRVTGDTDISGSANIQGAATLRSTLTVNGAVTIPNTISIGNTTVTGFINVSSTANIGGDVNLRGLLTVNGAVSIPNTISVGNTTVTGFINVSSTANVGGAITIGGGITATGNSSITNGLIVATSNATANVITIGAANSIFDSGVLFVDSVNNRVGINNTAPAVALRVTGAVDITSTANIQGQTNLRNKLEVDNQAIFNGGVVLVGNTVTANGSTGTSGQVLASNGASGSPYWRTTVTSVSSGNGLTGGPITGSGTLSVVANNGLIANATGIFVNANTGIIANSTGVFSNSAYIQTITVNNANNSSFLGTIAAANYVQNTDSRTLSGNLVFSAANVAFTNNITITGTVTANGSTGTGGYVLTSNGASGSPYWNQLSDKIKAWARFGTTSNGNSVIVRKTFNVSSTSFIAGAMTLNLVNAMSDTNFACFVSANKSPINYINESVTIISTSQVTINYDITNLSGLEFYFCAIE